MCVLATSAGTGSASAQEQLRAGSADDWALSLSFDNDWVAGTDSSYTTGFRAVVSQVGFAEARDEDNLARNYVIPFQRFFLPGNLAADPTLVRQSAGLGFSVFTPEDTAAENPPADQRPYGSYAYVLYGLEQDYRSEDNEGKLGGRFLLSDRFLSNLEIQAGLIGPEPGKSILEGFHRIWPNGGNAAGWESRHINYEPALNVFYNRVWAGFPLPRLFGARTIDDWRSSPAFLSLPLGGGWDLSVKPRPHLGFALGNVYTYGSGGLEVRAGLNVPDNIGPPTIRPAAPGGDYFPPRGAKTPIALYGFAGYEGRAVLYNAFLDGNLFSESPEVDKKSQVHDLHAGVALEWWRLRLSYARVFRTAEFDGQGDTSFGAITLGLNFGL